MPFNIAPASKAHYWLIDPLRHEVVIYALHAAGRYRPQGADEQGAIHSRLLPAFSLTPALLWDEAQHATALRQMASR